MAFLTLQQVAKLYPGQVEAVADFSLAAAEGELVTLVGPSGCGKTTILRMVAGLETPTSGTISVGGEEVTGIPAHRRDVAMVFQDYALYPHLTVAKNMAFGLERQGLGPTEIGDRLREAAQWLEIERLLKRRPAELSGGERQRVALGRAIVRRPRVFLFDEPLANLDTQLRDRARNEIATLQRRLGTTAIYVTHDQSEALALGHRVAVMDRGRLLQLDTPRQVYAEPASQLVASLIGRPPMNFLAGGLTAGRFCALHGDLTMPLATEIEAERVVLGVRPEAIVMGDQAQPLGEGLVDRVEWLGDHSLIHFYLAGTPWVARVASDLYVASNTRVPIAVRTGGLHLFEAAPPGRRLITI